MATLKFSVKTSGFSELDKKIAQVSGKAEHVVAIQVQKDTEPFVPALNKSLVNRTEVVGDSVIYPAPYARYLYYGKVMVDEHGNGPNHFVDRHGNEVIRFPKGSKLHATDRNLVFNHAVHPNAQDHWYETSKSQNLEKWLRVADKAVKNGLK